MLSSDTASTTSTLASSHRQSSLSSKLKGKLRSVSQSRSNHHGMPLITPSAGIGSETSTLVDFPIIHNNLDSYVLEPSNESDFQDDSDLEAENTSWSSRQNNPKTKSRPITAALKQGRDATMRPTSTVTPVSNAATSARNSSQHLHSK